MSGLKKLTNESLVNHFFAYKNIEILEYLIDLESLTRANLQRELISNKVDFGNFPKKKELKRILDEVSADVNKFLGTDIDPCKIEYINIFSKNILPLWVVAGAGTGVLYLSQMFGPFTDLAVMTFALFSLYNIASKKTDLERFGSHYLKNRISLSKLPSKILKTTLAHEFAHHVQMSTFQEIKSQSNGHFNIFLEGHARGTQRNMALKYSIREKDESYIYHTTDLSLAELKSAYTLLCGNFNVNPNLSLLYKNYSYLDKGMQETMFSPNNPAFHVIGNALFQIFEVKHGKQIYSEILKDNFP